MASNKPNKMFNKNKQQKGHKSQQKQDKLAMIQKKKVQQKKEKNDRENDIVDSDDEEQEPKNVKKVQQKISKNKQQLKSQKPQQKSDKKQAKIEGKEQKKQQKQVQQQVQESDDDESSDIEIDNDAFVDEDFDKQNELLGELAQMKKTNTKKDRKDKERKVTEFKFRVLDMLEIFIKKTKNPHIFIQSLAQVFQCIKDNSQDKEKQAFVEKICQIVRKFFDRHIKMLPEYKDNVDECFVEVVRILAKEPKKRVNAQLTFAAISLLKIRLQMNIGDNTILLQNIEKALEKSALKKEISYSEEFYKEIIRTSNDIAFKLLNTLLKYALLHKDGGAKEKNKQIILNLLNYTIKNSAVQAMIKQKPADSINGLIQLTTVFEQQEEFKKKKIGVLNKYVEIFSVFAGILKETKSQQKEELLNKVKKSTENWPENDHNLKSIQKKLTEKFVF